VRILDIVWPDECVRRVYPYRGFLVVPPIVCPDETPVVLIEVVGSFRDPLLESVALRVSIKFSETLDVSREGSIHSVSL
jgi:hypothetical protein